MSPPELAELRRQLKELLDAGPALQSPFGAPVLSFRRKMTEASGCAWTIGRLTRLPSKISIRFQFHSYPIYSTSIIIRILFLQIGLTILFVMLLYSLNNFELPKAENDLYYQVWLFFIYGVMPFGLTNAPATFCTLLI